jgi:hypothetical protein
MNRKIALTLVIASAFAGSAFAETPMASDNVFQSAASRASVQAELQQHRQAGVDAFADGYDQLREFRSERTRTAVQAEYMAARDQVAAMTSEDSGAVYISRRELPRTVGSQLAALPVVAE